MYVCVCNAITESQIRVAAESGVKTLRGVREYFETTRNCGRCAQATRQALGSCRACGKCEGRPHLVRPDREAADSEI